MRPIRLAIDLSPVTDLDDFNDVSRIINAVDNAIVPLPDPISLGIAGKLFAAWRARLVSQLADAVDHTAKVVHGKFPEFLFSRALDDETSPHYS